MPSALSPPKKVGHVHVTMLVSQGENNTPTKKLTWPCTLHSYWRGVQPGTRFHANHSLAIVHFIATLSLLRPTPNPLLTRAKIGSGDPAREPPLRHHVQQQSIIERGHQASHHRIQAASNRSQLALPRRGSHLGGQLPRMGGLGSRS